MRVSRHRTSVAEIAAARFWQVAVLAAAATVVASSRADAALYYWQDYYDGGYYRPARPVPPRRQRMRHAIDKKMPKAEKETGAKPVGPLIIAISIEKQRARIYDANGLFAESPVSTGMKGHPTPMGVFSVIQKHKWHQSNIYSGAPMPYMQRITWSGVAMHAGVLPGYPASHGCIRMPTAFAQKMWNWTRMGARVIITPGEVTPASFSHPLLVAQKVAPVATEAVPVDAPLGVKSDKGANASPALIPTAAAGKGLDLRSTVGHGSLTQTADASSAAPANAAITLSDAAPTAASDEATVAVATTEPVKTATPETLKADEPGGTPDAKKDPSRLPGIATPEPKREGQVAVFISRKDGKLYVRQNFKPIFEVPVTITSSERPLGTHVFTAEVDKTDPNRLRWSVVSLPVSARDAWNSDADARATRRRKMTGILPAEAKAVPAPNGPAEALDRITVPQDAMTRIAEALTTGGSIVVSDHGINQGETGEGTDFIVPLR